MAYWSDSGVRATSFAGGSGTSSSPYLISTPAQLGYLSYLINSSTSSSYKTKCYKVTADLNMSSYYWIPIGYNSSSYSFNGTFDGDGHTISFLNINGAYSGTGLFGHLGSSSNNGSIKNIKLKSPTINLNGTATVYAGFIAGQCNKSTIDNVYIYNPCLVDSNSSSHFVGGIAGRVYYSTSISDIYLDYFQVSTSVSSVRIGGIVGTTDSASLAVERANIELEVKGSSAESSNYSIGGIIGYNQNLSNSYTSNLTDINVSLDVTYKSSSSTMGGLIGNLSANISASNITIANIVINKCKYSGSSNTYDGALVGGSYTCVITRTTNTGLSYNTDNSNITNYSNGLSSNILSDSNKYSFSSGFKPNSGLYFDKDGNNVKGYMITAYGDNWLLYNTMPFVNVPYAPSDAKKVHYIRLTDWNVLYNFGDAYTNDNVLKSIYIIDGSYTIPFPDKYGYLGVTLDVNSLDGNTVYLTNASPGTTISIDGDRNITVNDLDKTKIISYKKDSSTTVEVENIYYKTDSSTIKTMTDYKYKKDSSTLV